MFSYDIDDKLKYARFKVYLIAIIQFKTNMQINDIIFLYDFFFFLNND